MMANTAIRMIINTKLILADWIGSNFRATKVETTAPGMLPINEQAIAIPVFKPLKFRKLVRYVTIHVSPNKNKNKNQVVSQSRLFQFSS